MDGWQVFGCDLAGRKDSSSATPHFQWQAINNTMLSSLLIVANVKSNQSSYCGPLGSAVFSAEPHSKA